MIDLTFRRRALRAQLRAVGIAVAMLLYLPAIAAAEGQQSVAPHYVWALDVAAPNGRHNLLMGTLHVSDRHLNQPDPRILDSYRLVVYEHKDVDSGVAPAVPWREAVSTDDIAQLRVQLQCSLFGLSPSDIDRQLARVLAEPTPLEAVQWAYQRCAATDYAPRDSIVALAQIRYARTVTYLETPEQAGDAPRQIAQLLGPLASGQSVHVALSNDAINDQADLVDALNAGDYGAVATVLDRSLERGGIAPKPYYDVMVRQRNWIWMQTLPPLLDQGGAFVLVGAGHLPGKDGLIELLKRRGYTVRPIQVPAGSGTWKEASGG